MLGLLIWMACEFIVQDIVQNDLVKVNKRI